MRAFVKWLYSHNHPAWAETVGFFATVGILFMVVVPPWAAASFLVIKLLHTQTVIDMWTICMFMLIPIVLPITFWLGPKVVGRYDYKS